MSEKFPPQPPVALVKTWIDLITSNQPEEVRKHASAMLIRAFGSMEAVVAFAKQHGLVAESGNGQA